MDYPRLLTSQSLIWKLHAPVSIALEQTFARFAYSFGLYLHVVSPFCVLSQASRTRAHQGRQTHDGRGFRFECAGGICG